MAFQQDTSGQGFSPDTSSRGQNGLGSRLFGTSICYETAVCFNCKHSDGGTGGSCSVVLVVSPLVYLINYGSHRRVNTAATLQAVYLVWLFLGITTTCNLSIFGLVRKRFPESFAHAQTVDTGPLFPPPTWPGYEAMLQHFAQTNIVCPCCALASAISWLRHWWQCWCKCDVMRLSL